MTPTGMPPRTSARPFTPARDRVAPGAWLVGLGVVALLVASASLDGPGWFDPGEQCALDSSGGISSAASGPFAKETRFFPPRVTCSLGGSVHAYQSEARSWLIGAVLVGALACLDVGVVLLWRRARRKVPASTPGRPVAHIALSAVLGVVVCLGWSAVGLIGLFLAETAWGAVAAAALCLATTLPVIIRLDGALGPPRRRLTTSWWRAIGTVLVGIAAAATAATLAGGAAGGAALRAAAPITLAGGTLGFAGTTALTWLLASGPRKAGDRHTGSLGSSRP